MATHDVLLLVSATLVAGVACQAIAQRLRIPAIVPLLLAGVALGPETARFLFGQNAHGIIDPALLGGGLRVLVAIAVAIILFEGGLSLKAAALRLSGRPIRNLVVFGSLITWALAAGFALLLIPDLGPGLAVLFGALVIVTGPTVIAPLINAVHPRPRIAEVLRGEAILIDPVGALLAVFALEFILSADHGGPWVALTTFGSRVLLGCVLGGGGAYILNQLLKRPQIIPLDLKNLVVLVSAIALYGVSEAIMHESGVLTATLAGFLLGWLHPPGLDEVEEFKGHLTVLSVSIVFILLAANLKVSEMVELGWPAVLVVLAIMLLVRPAAIFICGIGTELSLKEKLFLSWIAPRGIVAASVSSLFAIQLADNGISGGRTVMNLTFAVIVGTVMIQGPTARWVGRFLGVLEPARNGVLIVGANRLGQHLGRALKLLGVRVLAVDTNAYQVRETNDFGVEARRANALDEFAIDAINLDGIGNLLALTPNDNVNRLAVRLYTNGFGRDHVRGIRHAGSPDPEMHGLPYLFGDRLDFDTLNKRLAAGWTIETADVDERTPQSSVTEATGGGIVLLSARPDGSLRFLDDDAALEAGETAFYLAPLDEEKPGNKRPSTRVFSSPDAEA